MCIEQNQTGLIEQLKKSFTFQLSLSSKELFHSNFLAWIADVDDDLFQKLIVGFIKDKNTTQLELKGKWSAEREYHNYDLCVLDDIIDDPDNPEIKGNIRLILENKVKSIPYKAQLDQYKNEVEQSIFSKINFHRRSLSRKKYPDYAGVIDKASGTCEQRINAILEELKKDIYNNNRHVKSVSNDCLDAINKLNKVHYVLLSLTENFPEKQEIIDSGWTVVSYKQYAEHLKCCLEEIKDGTFKTVCSDYYSFIDSFHRLFEEWRKEERFKYYNRPDPGDKKAKTKYEKSYLGAKSLRIHDIYLKQKVSVMATNIYQNLKKKPVKGLMPQIVLGDADKNILSMTEAFLGVGYGYLHGSPLVEIKYKPEGEKFMFIIQVQGDAYEHGIIWKDTTPEECWENAKTKKVIIEGWLSTDISLKGSRYSDHQGNQKAFPSAQIFTSDKIFPDRPNTRSKNNEESDSSEQNESNGVPYYSYKSQNSFVYQHIDLEDDVTMRQIENCMVSDIKRIIDLHNQKNC